jgi:signal transduction histidine kinase
MRRPPVSADRRLRESAELHRALFPVLHALPWPALIVDESGDVVCVNDAMQQRGIDVRAGEPRPMAEAAPWLRAAVRGEPPWEAQEALLSPESDGGEKHERLSLRPIAGGAVLLLTDETRLHQLEVEHAQTVRLASLGFMLAGVCHEISNPLAAIYSMLQILEKDTGADPEVLRRGLASISGNVRRILDISRELSGFSRAAAVPKRPAAVDPIVEEALSLARHERRFGTVTVEHHKDPDAVVRGNARELQQVFLNVISNALHAMDGEGRILITTRCLDGGTVEVMIQDDGPGIRPEHLDKLFEPFFSTKPRGEGTGLGLTISNEIVHEHGGRIRAESTWGKGARFYIELPLWSRGP